jgi:hypothetical protein
MQVDLAAALLGEYIGLLGSSSQALSPVLRDALARLVAVHGANDDDDDDDDDDNDDDEEQPDDCVSYQQVGITCLWYLLL